MATNDVTAVDFFTSDELVDDPYPYFAALRDRRPVTRESSHDVTMVTGWQEAASTIAPAPLARAETRVAIERLLDRTSGIRISEAAHGPADSRRYQYVPTYILRGLTELHLEFSPTQAN